MTDKIVVYCTCPTAEDAQRLASALVEQRLAACVNIVSGVLSVYRWQGAVENSPELMLIIKTRREHFPALRAALERLHPYELPEIIALPVVDGSPGYLDWLDKETDLSHAE
ncbi:MAG: divalent-cation tolerance protein CutA [Acidobacteria bacterium]|nr:divalent-cation tolerance protein CutA [Acidobacteriota bacterium]